MFAIKWSSYSHSIEEETNLLSSLSCLRVRFCQTVNFQWHAVCFMQISRAFITLVCVNVLDRLIWMPRRHLQSHTAHTLAALTSSILKTSFSYSLILLHTIGIYKISISLHSCFYFSFLLKFPAPFFCYVCVFWGWTDIQKQDMG